MCVRANEKTRKQQTDAEQGEKPNCYRPGEKSMWTNKIESKVKKDQRQKRKTFGKCYCLKKGRERELSVLDVKVRDRKEKKDEGQNISGGVIYSREEESKSEHKSPPCLWKSILFIGCSFIYGSPLGTNHQRLWWLSCRCRKVELVQSMWGDEGSPIHPSASTGESNEQQHFMLHAKFVTGAGC